MKYKLLPIGLYAVAIGIMLTPMLISDTASAQSARKMGSVIQKCYTTDGRNVPCDRLQAENKKAKAKKDQTK
jgi:hypothetical protein